MSTDLTALADALTGLVGGATPGEWWPSLADSDSDEYDEVFVGTVETGDLHSLAIGTIPNSARNVQLMAASPSLARSLAAVLRAMAARHADHIGGQTPTVVNGCNCHFCEHRRDVLAAVEPLIPLLPDTET